MQSMWWFSTVLCLVVSSSHAEEEAPLIWASAGGGWRAMTTIMGYANVFSKAGLITSESTAFQSISTNSGASWFSTQFFFSQRFFNKTLVDDTQELYDFIVDWMDSYARCFPKTHHNHHHNSEKVISENEDTMQLALFFGRHLELSTPKFFHGMLDRVSTDYGDAGFVDRPASPENRVPAMQNTSLYLQAGLSPLSRVRRNLLGAGTYSYLGPASTDSQHVYRVLLPYQLAVEAGGSKFFIGTEEESLPLKIYTSKAKRKFRFKDWEDYHLYEGPETTGTIVSEDTSLETAEGSVFADPFGGQPNAAQAALFGATFTSKLDGLAPATFAQERSLQRYSIDTSGDWLGKKIRRRLGLTLTTAFLYRATEVAQLGLCSQWPNDCDIEDTELADGGFTDGTSLGMHLARYSEYPRVKAIVTLNNFATDLNVRFLSYFNTTFNANVEPGEFLWGPPTGAEQLAQPNPGRSIQMFEEYLDEESFLDSLEPVADDASVSHTLLNVTTIENPATGVVASQRVELLVFVLRGSEIPTAILGKQQINRWKVPLAENARNIANSPGILSLVQDFVAS